ncbi:hypothetical protein HDA32_000477 [Spinactinospora alkalitolerans]|uniref:Secreted protein n=1 Tax=Spinactinospora alkalitolerans TaxID=687207 RepID=A0A852TQ03_9ACTN|nr:hypothetical protein [Spinactinospora alkalitolerans]NYE45357.1 hypothetical protein [Spinactinospora alkalitolerans]
MKRLTAIAFGFTVAAVASVGAAGAASADEGPAGKEVAESVFESNDPEATYEGLSDAERAAFDSYVLPAEQDVQTEVVEPQNDVARQIEESGGAPETLNDASVAGCWVGRADGSAQAAAGNTLYTFYVEGSWCSNGVTVTSASYDRAGGETSTPGWRYEGVNDFASGVSAGNQGVAWAQHSFVLGAGGWDIQHPLECIRLRGAANGNAYADYTCSVNF